MPIYRRPIRLSRDYPDIIAFALVCALALWGLVLLATTSGYNWQWYRIPKYLYETGAEGIAPGLLLQGLGMSLQLSAVSLVLSFCIGLTVAVLRLSPWPVARAVARVYVETIRNTPLLVQIFFMYFVLAPIIGLERFASGVLALSLFEGAYAAEIIRSGIQSLSRGQWEASYSLGLTLSQTYARIILPQALRRVLPPLAGQGVALIKDSALLSTISIFELAMQAQVIVAESFLTFEVWFTVAALYVCITWPLSTLINRLDTRLKAQTA